MSFESNNFKVVKKTRLPKSEFTVDCSVLAEGEIAKVYAVAINVYDDNQEVTEGVVSYSGHVDVCMIYGLETGEVESACATCPFSSKFESADIVSGEKAIIKIKVVDHSISSVEGNEAKILITLEQTGVLISSAQINSITSVGNDVCAREEEISVVRFIGAGQSQATETLENNNREKVKKVLGAEAVVLIKTIEPGVNFVSVGGDIITKILFVDDNDKFDSVTLYDSFKEEVEIEGVSRESLVEAYAKINSSQIKVAVEDQEKGSKLTVTIPFEVSALSYEEITVKTIEDLYSLTHEMEISTESFNMSKVLPIEIIEGKIDGTLTLDENQPRVDKILFTFGNSVELTNSFVENGELTIEGIAKTSVVYLNDDLSSLNSVELEIPFSISEKTKATEDSLINVDAILTDVDVAVKKGRELFFDAKVKGLVVISDDDVSAVITEAVDGEALPEKDFAMQVIFAKEGDSLWDVAKLNHLKETEIVRQNPGVSFPLQENTDIIVFYQNS